MEVVSVSEALNKHGNLTYSVQQTKSTKSDKPDKGLARTWWFYAIVASLAYLLVFWLAQPIKPDELAANIESYQFIMMAAISALVFAIVAHKFNWMNTRSGQIMMSVSVGFLLYTLAEILYLLLSLSTGGVPVPSIADVFWISAYIPFAIAFTLTIRTIRMRFTRPMLALWATLSAATFIAVVGIVVIPIIAAVSGPDAMSTVFSMVYPFEDAVVIVLVLVILLKFRSGEVAKPWAVLILGFILTSIGDIWFGYANSPLGNYSMAYDPVDLFLSLGYLASIAAGLLFVRTYGER
jgi:hypothetical protein